MDKENYVEVSKLLELLKENLEEDYRFDISFHCIGQWGGSQDEAILVCEPKEIYDLFAEAKEQGLSIQSLHEALQPKGSTCYAANPFSYVIGSDGTVYKCTVALYDPRNKVGELLHDGTMDVDQDKLDLWTETGEVQDSGCQKCFFRPACQGNVCPLKRMQLGKAPCPPYKLHIKRTLAALV